MNFVEELHKERMNIRRIKIGEFEFEGEKVFIYKCINGYDDQDGFEVNSTAPIDFELIKDKVDEIIAKA